VDALRLLGDHQRLADELLGHLAREVVLDRAPVEGEGAGPRYQSNADDRLLAPPHGLDRPVTSRSAGGRRRGDGLGHRDRGGGADVGHYVLAHWLTCLISNGCGCCAACGCSGPAYTFSFLMS